MSCEEFTRALGISAAHAGRELAWNELAAHGRECEACQRLWEADRLLRLSHEPTPRFAMSMELRAAIAAERGEPPRPSLGTSARVALIIVPTLMCVAAAFLAFARSDLRAGMPRSFWWGALAPLALMTALVPLQLYRGHAGFGLSAGARWVSVGAAALALWAIGGMSSLHTAPAPLLPTPQDCAFLGFVVALAVGGGAFLALRGRVLVGARAAGATCAAIGGAAAGAFLQLHCTAPAGLHVQVVHLLPFLWALPIGVLAGRRFLRA